MALQTPTFLQRTVYLYFWLCCIFVETGGLSWPDTYGILVPGPETESVSRVLEGAFLTTGPPGSSLHSSIYLSTFSSRRSFIHSFTFHPSSSIRLSLHAPVHMLVRPSVHPLIRPLIYRSFSHPFALLLFHTFTLALIQQTFSRHVLSSCHTTPIVLPRGS